MKIIIQSINTEIETVTENNFLKAHTIKFPKY